MSLSKINDDVETLKNKILSDGLNKGNRRKIILLSDSKGRYLRKQVCRDNNINIHFINHKGANIFSEGLIQQTVRAARFERKPIALIWFGTCEFTVKTGKVIRVPDRPECIELLVEQVIVKYRELKNRIQRVNSSAEVYFVECPPMSIKRWIEKHSCRGDEYIADDVKLTNLIKTFNRRLCELNGGIELPKITQDMIRSSKPKNRSKTKYKVNWTLYTDGIHPCDLLAKLWLYRLYSFARRRSPC